MWSMEDCTEMVRAYTGMTRIVPPCTKNTPTEPMRDVYTWFFIGSVLFVSKLRSPKTACLHGLYHKEPSPTAFLCFVSLNV